MNFFKRIFFMIFISLILVLIFSLAFPYYFYLIQEPNQLYKVIDSADRLVITRNNDDKKIIYVSSDREEIESFKKSFKVDKNFKWFIPSCRGMLGINFYKGKQQVANIAYLRNSDIRSDSIGYLKIQNKDLLKEWFEDRNISTL